MIPANNSVQMVTCDKAGNMSSLDKFLFLNRAQPCINPTVTNRLCNS
jgi:hypothetical protein